MVALPKKVSGLCPRLSLIEKERTALNSNAEINTFISNTNLESIRRFIMSGNADKHKIFYVVRQRNILLFQSHVQNLGSESLNVNTAGRQTNICNLIRQSFTKGQYNYLMDQEQFFEEPDHHEYVEIRQLPPANPIYLKPIPKEQKPVLRIELIKNQILSRQHLRPVFKKQTEPDDEPPSEQEQQLQAFQKHFEDSKCVYRRYNNSEYNSNNGTCYYSSCFIDRRFFRQNKQPIGSLRQMHSEVLGQDLSYPAQAASKEVVFDSNFESGNLFAAFKKSPTEYDLVLQNDVNSRGNTQWFYFSVTNLPQNVEITFNIVNLLKSDSLFNYGMLPVVLSQAKLKKNGESWSRQGRAVSYYKNTIKRQRSRRYYYTLTFKLTSKIPNDRLFVAHCYPYTYSMLNQYISQITKVSARKGLTISKESIGKTVGNNSMDVLTVTETNSEKKQDAKKLIVILSRQHPGQTQGSYVCEGLITFLLGKSKQAEYLRKNFIFKIIPMVNPDGVIVGNYRTNLMGYDLNRKWDVFDKDKAFPEVASIKYYINEINKEKRIKCILDLHGHSKKLNSFFYGNPNPQQPEMVRGFPYTCAKLNERVSFGDCTFSIEEEKKKAARVYLSLLHQITHVYTFESSFYGYAKEGKKIPFAPEDFRSLGATLVQGLHSLFEFQTLVEAKASTQKVSGTVYNKYLVELRQNPNLLNIGDDKSSGSDSHPDEFEALEPVPQMALNNSMKPLERPTQQQAVIAENSQDTLQYQKKCQQTPDILVYNHKKQHASVPRVTTSNPLSRKSNRAIKNTRELSKNPRQLKVMEISRVNSVLPDKYELALEPAGNSTGLSKNQGQKGRFRKSLRAFFTTIDTQTDTLHSPDWAQMRPSDCDYCISTPAKVRPQSSKYKDYQMKYVSLTSSKCKKTLMLKLDLMSKPLDPIGGSNVLSRYSHTSSQTYLTFCFMQNYKTNKSQIPTERSMNRQVSFTVPKAQPIRSVRLSLKRQSQPISQLRKQTDSTKKKPYSDEVIFNQRVVPYVDQISELVDRPLMIRKKQILVQRKPVLPKGQK